MGVAPKTTRVSPWVGFQPIIHIYSSLGRVIYTLLLCVLFYYRLLSCISRNSANDKTKKWEKERERKPSKKRERSVSIIKTWLLWIPSLSVALKRRWQRCYSPLSSWDKRNSTFARERLQLSSNAISTISFYRGHLVSLSPCTCWVVVLSLFCVQVAYLSLLGRGPTYYTVGETE